ncbi:uncharacterized protein A1O5_01698 [Cladophialophora psammophila CBS 110553]|uniref:Uncharacterized protein n=1 Tax=Cladophialophora psammophila CBS 110553 TaxID=1182543 RepID=W9X3F4_9EURO|nr:uncharacterized protein A1O5_01698 [Cladophialophora psammophila CBS 110553]EXJ75002.1 hypothetical protein A1O5_01698 [Cladophialophora psammophila CBS 110553]
MQPAGAEDGDFDGEKRLRSAHFFREVVYSSSKFWSDQGSGRSQLPDHNGDPLLENLYSTEWSTALIDDMGIGDVKLSYKPETYFPFFARRLEILQEFSLAQTPSSWKLLWKDRRDLNRFYTLWATLIFGILTLSMGLIQILLTIAQVVAGFRVNGGN